MSDVVDVPAEHLHRFAAAVARGAGMSAEDAEILAVQLVWRDLREANPVGLIAFPSVLRSIRDGSTDPAAQPIVVSRVGPTLVIDAKQAWGQIAAARAMRQVVEQARASGIGLGVIRNADTASALGYYPTIAIDQRMIGLVSSNAPALQPPWGSTQLVLGNQPFSFGAPAGKHHPILFDASSTAISRSAIGRYARRGQRLPEGVALGPDGMPTTDPAAALLGSLLPMGGHKGYGISVMWEVLTGILSGSATFGADMPNDPKQPQDISLFLLVIDPEVVMPHGSFTDRVDAFIDQLHAATPAPGVDRVYAPGERGYLQAAQRGGMVPLPASRLGELEAIGREYAVAW